MFNVSLKRGQLGERIISKWLEKKGFEIIGFSDEKDYDIETLYKGQRILFEIKTDLYEYYKKYITNNLFIEVSYNGNPSGIMSSEADIFIYYMPLHNILYMTKIESLIKSIKENPDKFCYTSLCGDGGRSNGYKLNRLEYGSTFFEVRDIKLKEWPFT
jgi:hypothetical protein